MNRIQAALAKLQQERAAAVSPVPLASVGPVGDSEVPTRSHRLGYRADRVVRFDVGALRRSGLLAPESDQRRLADEYREIKRPLLLNAAGGGASPVERGNLIMLGSALPGEGKTFTSINLCMSLAQEKDWSVVLVDGDVAKQHLTTTLGLDDEPGLLDLLREPQVPVESYVIPTDVPGLAVLPAGSGDQHATELLSSSRMDRIARHLSESDPRRVCVFDSPPFLATSEALGLASHVGQIAIIVHAGHTPSHCVRLTLEKLDPSKAVSLILNQAESNDNRPAYGGAYGY